jgi:acylphosphatase
LAAPGAVRWQLVVAGRVQGVGYRARVAASARGAGLVGSVANLPDGTVLIDVQGPEERVERFLGEIREPRGLSRPSAVRKVGERPVARGRVGFEIVHGRTTSARD